MPADFEFSGLEGVLQRLQEWGDDALAAADGAVETAAADAASGARAAVPVRTGNLQRSITSQRLAWGLAVVEAGEGVAYVRPIESAPDSSIAALTKYSKSFATA